jgi:peroxiredoxin
MSMHAVPMPGDPLPSLAIDTLGAGRVDLATRAGWRLLVIYRGAHCPACAKYLAKLSAQHARLQTLGVETYALSTDPGERARKQAEEAGWPFEVGHDVPVDTLRGLGLYISATEESEKADRSFAEPGLFLVNPDDQLQVIDVSNAPFSRPDLEQIVEGIETVQEKQPPIHGTV